MFQCMFAICDHNLRFKKWDTIIVPGVEESLFPLSDLIDVVALLWWFTAITENLGVQDAGENVIFLHGFLSSSSFWAETVFPNISDPLHRHYKLFAVDLLGFGSSPKPRDCLYTLKDHLEMIEKSVICPFQLTSFHLVAHSMGCLIAIALAAKHSHLVKSITLVAPVSSPELTINLSLPLLSSCCVIFRNLIFMWTLFVALLPF